MHYWHGQKELPAACRLEKTPGGCDLIKKEGFGGGGGSCQIEFAVVYFAAGYFAEAPGFCVVNFADTPRNVVVCKGFAGAVERGCRCEFRGSSWILCVKCQGQFETQNFPHEVDCPRNPPPPP